MQTLHQYAVEAFAALLAALGVLAAKVWQYDRRLAVLQAAVSDLDDIAARTTAIETRLAAMATREDIARLEGRMEALDERLDSIMRIIDRHERWLDEGRTDR